MLVTFTTYGTGPVAWFAKCRGKKSLQVEAGAPLGRPSMWMTRIVITTTSKVILFILLNKKIKLLIRYDNISMIYNTISMDLFDSVIKRGLLYKTKFITIHSTVVPYSGKKRYFSCSLSACNAV